MVRVRKTIKCKLIKPTELKLKHLNKENNNLQELLQLEKFGLDFLPIYNSLKKKIYSANIQQALRFYKKIKLDKEYPISFRKDLLEVRKTDNKLSEYWVKIPTKQRKGGLNLAIKSQPFLFEDYEICESKLFKKKNNWFLNLTVQKEVELNNTYDSVLGLDLGQKYMGVSVMQPSALMTPKFYGKEVRGIRRKYDYIRKQLGKKKLLKEIKRFGQKEQRKVTDCLHKISNEIVNLALTSNSTIVVGDLKGIRKSAKGRNFNRIVSNMPYLELTQILEHKANWEGIRVIKVNERGTSHTCSKCGSEGSRPKQGVFNCSVCGLKDFNADINGASNIGNKVSSGYILEDGATLTLPETDAYKTSESPNFSEGRMSIT